MKEQTQEIRNQNKKPQQETKAILKDQVVDDESDDFNKRAAPNYN